VGYGVTKKWVNPLFIVVVESEVIDQELFGNYVGFPTDVDKNVGSYKIIVERVFESVDFVLDDWETLNLI